MKSGIMKNRYSLGYIPQDVSELWEMTMEVKIKTA